MKIKHFFMALLAGAAVFTACQEKEEDLGPAKVTVSPVELAFDAAEGSKTVELTATRDWTIQSNPDWVALNVTSGQGSSKAQTITVSVTENKSNNREGEVIFTIGLSKATLKVTQVGPGGEIQMGDGTLESPFSVAGAIKFIEGLGADVNSPNPVYVKGKISQITEEFGTQYGNGTFYITDDGTTSGTPFYAYRILYLGNKRFASGDTQIKVGDEVVICGNVVNFKGNTPETVQGSAYLYSLNGVSAPEEPAGTPEGDGSLEKPFNVAAAIDAVKDLTWTSNTEYQKVGPYYITGKVSAVDDGYSNNTYGNGTFEIVDEEGGAAFKVYRALYLGNQKWAESLGEDVKVGDVVIVYAELMNYRGNTPETVQNGGYLYSLNGKTAPETPTPTPGDPKGTGTEADPYNPAAANAAAKALSWTSNDEYEVTEPVYVKGKITSIKDAFSAKYGNASFYISEDGNAASETFYAFRVLYFGNEKWAEGDMELKVGDEVVIYAPLMNYHNDTPETVANKGYLISINGQTGGSDTPEVTPGDPAGTGTESDPFNVAAAIAKALETGEEATADAYYIKGTVTGTPEVSAQYHNATFDIIDPGFESAVFKVFRVKSFDGADFEGTESIKEGDVVVVYAKIVNYKGNTPETEAGGSFISINGKTEFDKAEGGEATGTFASNVEWSLDSSAYTQDAKVNGTEGVTVLKLGTGSKYGTATLTLPDGATKLSFYAVSWNNAEVANLVFKVDGKEVATKTPAANSGLKGNPTYELTVTDSDYYTVDLKSAAKTVTVETSGGYRAALFGIQAK